MTKLTLLALSVLLLSACSLGPVNLNLRTEPTPEATATPTLNPSDPVAPTVSEDNSLDTIDAELKETVIPTEDFSDIQQ